MAQHPFIPGEGNHGNGLSEFLCFIKGATGVGGEI
jgi:hypothetical protein